MRGRVLGVAALCLVGAVVAFLLLRPTGDAAPALPSVRPVALTAQRLSDALSARAKVLRAQRALAGGRLDELLAQDPLDLSIPSLTEQGVTLRDVAVHRRGADATGEATVDPAQLAALAPAAVSDLRFDAGASKPGELVVRGKASALGFKVPVTVRVVVRDGAVVADPDGLPIDPIVVFDDPRVRVRDLRATDAGGGALRVRVIAAVTS